MSDPVPVQRELIKSSPPGGRRGIFYAGRFALNLYDGLNPAIYREPLPPPRGLLP